MKKLSTLIGILLVLTAGFVTYLFFTDQGVANEFRQIRQPRPNIFYVAIDVSATIDTATLFDLKFNLISRLKNFIGDEAVSYTVVSFGNPGCGMASVRTVVSTQSPKEEVAFKYEVEDPISEISVPKIEATSTVPLTTPLYAMMENVLPKRKGGRIIIFSDLLNEDSDCPLQYPFPEKAIREFGENKSGQIIFLYLKPHPSKVEKQEEFIERMKKLSGEGVVRAFFYPIPERIQEQGDFLEAQLQKAIPTTNFDIVRERVSRMVDTIVTAVRG